MMTTMNILCTALCIVQLLSLSCRKESEEDRVSKVIGTVQKAAGEKKINAVLDHVAKDYQDPQGNDRAGIKGLLAFYFFRHQAVSVHIPSIEVQVNGPSAAARFQAILTARGTDGATAGVVLPDALGIYDFEVSLRKEDGAWKVLSARWTRTGEGSP